MILAAGLSPAWQQIMRFEQFRPGEVNRAAEVHRCASGKVLNVGLGLARLGAPCRTLTVLGGAPLVPIQQEFAALPASLRWIETAAETRTCTTILDAASGQTTELVEAAGNLTQAELAQFISAYREDAATAQVIVLTGSLPVGIAPSLYRDLLTGWSGRALLDVRGPELLAVLEKQPLLVKPNREELGMTLGQPLSTDEQLVAGMRELNHRGARWVLVSQGKEALWLVGRQEIYRFTPPRVQVVNPIGCGDCLAAGIAWRIAAGDDMPEAVRYGIAAAAENATTLLPSRLDPYQVKRLAASITQDRLSSPPD